METKGILIVGVGGQGVLRASDILSRVLMISGLDVKKSEVHGMAQRGGCVTSHVRYGEKVYSPLAKKHDCDVMISFEKMETLRYLDYLKQDGAVIVNTEEIYPPAVNLGALPYPQGVMEKIRSCFEKVSGRRPGPSLPGRVHVPSTRSSGGPPPPLLTAEAWDQALAESSRASCGDEPQGLFYWEGWTDAPVG
jgi:hypothetical protein